MRTLPAACLLSGAMSLLAATAPSQGDPMEPRNSFVPQAACSSLPFGTAAYSKEGLAQGAHTKPNALLADESPSRWRLLFDGRSLNGWTAFQRKEIPTAWHVADGAVSLTPLREGEPITGRADLRTTETFDNFELRLQWAIAPGGNSGMFFFVREGVEDRIWKVAPEMQFMDDATHEDGIELSHRSGGLYDLYAPRCNALKPPGEYNDVRLIVDHGHVEHWLNGYRVVEYDLDSADFSSHLAHSKFRDLQQFAVSHSGYLALQDHGDAIRFRNIRVRRLQG